MRRNSMIRSGAVLAMAVVMAMACGSDNAVAPKYEPQVVNTPNVAFSFQATGLQNVDDVVSYNWSVSSGDVIIHPATATTSGTITLRIKGLESVFRGRYARSGYHIEMYVLQGEGAGPLPVLLMMPDRTARRTAVLCLHPQGESAVTAPGGDAEQLVEQGYAVLAPDLSGTGELGRATDAMAFLGVQIGRTIVGIRAEEIVRCVRFLATHRDADGAGICALAFGEMSIPLLHAAAMDDSIARIALIESPVSFQSIVTSRFYNLDPASLIGNVLSAYDLPDLAACLAPRNLLMTNPIDALGRPAPIELVTGSNKIVRHAYSDRNAANRMLIRTGVMGSPITEAFIPWLNSPE